MAAKLARWGIDAHMGSFGVVNQVLLVALAIGLLCMIVWGYRMWWQRRPDLAGTFAVGRPVPRGALRSAPLPAVVAVVVMGAAIGWFLPVLGASLLAFVVLDLALAARQRSSAGRR
ncbi:PepSY domain-containing protein [Motilibacter aurantiacus]|uniref:PepSY domain-containing protein n=1 Tax=Motilibacter aurantiacus TaxID=2714955 RepID=UPI002F2B78DC